MADWMRVRARLTYANVTSTIAAALGLSTGGAYAVDKLGKDSVGSREIKAGAVRSEEVKDRSVTGRDLARRSIGGSHFKAGAVDGRAIGDGSVGDLDIATGAVTSRAIRDGGIGELDIEPDSLGGSRIRPGSLDGSDIADGSITGDDLRDKSITLADLGFVPLEAGLIGGDGASRSDQTPLTADFVTIATTQVRANGSGLLSLGSLNLGNPGDDVPPAVVSYRVLIDGVPYGGTSTLTIMGATTAAAPVALVAPGITPGIHTVELQAKVDVGNAVVGVRNIGALAGIRKDVDY